MRQKFILLMTLLLLLGSITTVSPNHKITIVEAAPSQNSLMIYHLLPPDVTTGLVSTKAEELFSLVGDVTTRDGRVSLINGNKTFEMNQATGTMWYADYSKLWNISFNGDLPSLAQCKLKAEGFLGRNDLFPGNSSFSGYGSSNATGYNPDTEDLITKILNIQVNYGFTVDSIQVAGPGGEISVSIGEGEEIIGMNMAWIDFEPYNAFPVIDFASALSLADLGQYTDEEHTLVYYWQDDFNQGFLQPMYEVTLSAREGDYDYEYIRYLPATTFHPSVKITNPVTESSYFQGDSITFNCTVSYGTAPYTYSWESNLDGILSSSSTFSTSSLSIGTRDEIAVSHAITLTVVDANDFECKDTIFVNVVVRSIPWIGIETVVIIALAIIGSASLISRRKKMRGLALLFVAIVAASYLLLPMTNANPPVAKLDYGNIVFVDSLTEYDDGIKEVGVEALTYPSGSHIPNADDLAVRFYNKVGGYSGWNKNFKWLENLAWEEDFKFQSAPNGGTDYIYIDTVDIAMFSGHGHPDGFLFTTNYDDKWLVWNEAKWGDGDLEWIGLDACNCLQWSIDGRDVFSRWGDALHGVHMIVGFDTTAGDVKDRGEKWATYMKDGLTVKDAWFKAGKNTEGSSKWVAVLYATEANDPWNPPTNCPSNDHLHGFGYVSSDPTSAKWWVWIAVQC